jgi:hypothetical protein
VCGGHSFQRDQSFSQSFSFDESSRFSTHSLYVLLIYDIWGVGCGGRDMDRGCINDSKSRNKIESIRN